MKRGKKIKAKQQRRGIAYNAGVEVRKKRGIADPKSGYHAPGSSSVRKQG